MIPALGLPLDHSDMRGRRNWTAATKQQASPSYRLAHKDMEFLASVDVRPSVYSFEL